MFDFNFNFNFNIDITVIKVEPKEAPERAEKKPITLVSSSPSTNAVAPKQTNSSSSSNSEKEARKEAKEREDREQREPRELRGRERDRERESSEQTISAKEKSSSKDSKRDKDDGESRKRDRSEKTRERERDRKYYSPVSPTYTAGHADGTQSPSWSPASQVYVFPEQNDRFHPDTYDERERDRDLSSISNSSKGSNNRRSQDSPDERDIKRRRIDGSKVWS